MQLQERYPDTLHAISLNVDFDDNGAPSAELQDQVRATLAKARVSCETVLCSDPMSVALNDFGIFSLPAVVIFDRQGQPLKVYDGLVDYKGEIADLMAGLHSDERSR